MGARYWPGRDASFGGLASDETLTFDLGSVFLIASFDIFNTHNAANNNRGTTSFEVWISTNPVTPDKTSGPSLGHLVLSSGLTYPTSNPNPAQRFYFPPETGQYVTFRATGFVGAGAGLSEFEVNSTPDPGTVVLFTTALAALRVFRRARSPRPSAESRYAEDRSVLTAKSRRAS